MSELVPGKVISARLKRRKSVPVITTAWKHARHVKHTRHLSYPFIGIYAVLANTLASRNGAQMKRAIRAAELSNDHAAAQKWSELLERKIDGRHKRSQDRLSQALAWIRSVPYVLAAGAGALTLIGVLLAIGEHRFGALFEPWTFVAHVITWTILAVAAVLPPLAIASAVCATIALWHQGRKFVNSTAAPAWMRTSAEGAELVIDERAITQALAALRIPAITEWIKNGNPLAFVTPARVDGRGTHAMVRLPLGVTAESVGKRRADLAAGLQRAAKEVWPVVGSEAGLLDLWVSDRGALDAGAGPYPLLSEGVVDIFDGVPIGKTLRGDPAIAPMIERNSLVGGLPGSGKSSAARTLLAGAILDSTVEAIVLCPDSNADFTAVEPRCSTFIVGAEDEKVAQIRDTLAALHADVQKRGDLLIRYEEPSVTRELASKNVGLHPVVVLFEECHVAFGHDEYGDEIRKLAVDIVRLGRKRGIHLLFSTQAPTRDSIPRDVTRNCSNGFCFAVTDHIANDALLGTGAHRAGISGTSLLVGIDTGTAMTRGVIGSGQRGELLQCYFISVSKENDEFSPIVERSMKELARRGNGVPGTGRRLEMKSRDLLEDLAEILADETERVRLADLPSRLRKLAGPTWKPYADLTGTELRQLLDDLDVPTTNGRNVPRVDPEDIRRALAARG